MRFFLKDGLRSRFTLSPTGWILLTFSIGYILAIRYFHYASSHDPTSYFFDPGSAYQKRYSTKRIREAEAFIQAAKSAASPVGHAGHPPRMCVGVATVSRRAGQYVHLTIGSVLAGLSQEDRKDVFLNVLVAHTDGSKHPTASETWFTSLLDHALQYDPDGADWAQIKTWEDGGWYRNKTIYDYTYVLRSCYETGSDYIAMIEDDTLLMRDWYPRARNALRNVEDVMLRRPAGERWIYLRMFYSDDLLGWNSEEWPQYLFWSILVWSVVTAAFSILRGRFRRSDLYLTDRSVVVLSTVCVALSIILHFMAGRHTTHPMSSGIHEMNKYGCCSQGLVFPREIVPKLLAQTDLTTDWLVDMMVEKIADKERWTRWATVPPLLQHIGATSSKGYGFDDNAKKLWSFRFEDWKV